MGEGDNAKYLFVSDNGYYMGWQTDGESESYYTGKTYNEKQPFRIKAAGQCMGSNGQTYANLFGKVCLQGYYTKSGVVGYHYLLYNFNTKNYHRGNPENIFYGDNAHTIYYILEEAGDYTTNVVKVNAATGIEGVEGAQAPLFDLQGRRVQKAGKGLYIQGGKKFMVK